MSNNTITLFYLVDGKTACDAFAVDIPSNKTISHLKNLIKTAEPCFDGVAASLLTLWRVDHRFIAANMDDPVHQRLTNPRTKLAPFFRISDVFREPLLDMTIHIIVERPPSPETHTKQKIVPIGHLENELAAILEQVDHHLPTPPIDPNVVEAAQRQILGSFYKRTLPYHREAEMMSLVMLGLELNKEAKTSDNDKYDIKNIQTLRSIVQKDVREWKGQHVVAMVAPSGSGKTATVIDLASKHFTIYCACCFPDSRDPPEFKGLNFMTLADDVEKIYRHIAQKKPPQTPQDQVAIDSEVKLLARERVTIEFLARILFLQLLLHKNPALEPLQFFREQTSGKGSDLTISTLVTELKNYDPNTIKLMLGITQSKLQSFLAPRKLGLVIALDEAQIANGILPKRLISPSAVLGNINDL